MKLAYFDDNACSIPFVWMTASLVLDPHSVTYDEWCEGFGMLAPFLFVRYVSMS